ncbi:anthranilate synthase component I [Sneathiella aquimaris]|uniref:anthranilate synthase component I n=1 Tax=Sneathiella aquimaris TaxID=2599305 RepID=UPI00146E9A97|nr:anthranilate synthase component I [Sneathiella aquimaris]
MSIQPAFSTFSAGFEDGNSQILWTTLVADLETPVSAMMKLAEGKANSFLLESVEGGAVRGRYSIIGMKPDLIWRCDGKQARINRTARFDPEAFVACDLPVLDSLQALIDESHIDLPEHLPPMAAGLVGYMSYDTVRLMEDIPDSNPNELGVPDGMFIRPTVMAIFDSILDVVTIVTPVWYGDGRSAQTAYNHAAERLSDAVNDFSRSLPHTVSTDTSIADLPEPVSNTTKDEYFQMVEKAKEYIRAGDIFQVVPSQRFEMPFDLPSLSLYRALRRTNPSPFMYYLNFGDFSVVGSSPEILVRLRDEKVTIRPIAGTRPRGATFAEDKALAEDLLSDPKELAEHLMLLDLGRNDVGRVARIGSVSVTEKMVIENYSHVMHIVSNVEGDIQDGLTAIDALKAGFPAGTVSGAPKVRAMEIIDELEKSKRGVYAGAVGYFSANGSMDTCIALRTAVVKDGKIYIQAGGGVVADSDPEAEYQETVNKAKALVRATQEAIRFASEGSGNR